MAMDLGSKQNKPGRASPNMNVTPLVDVQFWLNLPNKVEKNEPVDSDDSDRPIVVTVTKSGDFRINKDVIPKDQFANKLHRVLAAKQQRTIFFDAEDDAEFGKAAEALDLAREGGAATIAVLTDAIAD